MRSKESPNLYEILKSASAAVETPPETAPRIVVAPTPVAVQAPPPPPPTPLPRVTAPPRVVAAPPLPPAAPLPTQQGLGERTLRVTYNTAIFAGLIALGIVFLAYAIGLRVGRSRASAESTAVTERTPEGAADAARSAPGKVWTIKLREWPGTTAKERTDAEKEADALKKAMAQQALPAAGYDPATRTLCYGKYERLADAKEKLAAVKKFKLQGKTPFANAECLEIAP